MPLSWSDLPGRRVGIYGLGREGLASLRACVDRGISPVLVDDHPVSLADLDVWATAAGGLDLLLACDVVIKAPGVSAYSPEVSRLVDTGVQVVGGLGLWLAEAPLERVLCITGTKGKSTTTSIAGHLLRRWGYRTFMGGNLGSPPFDPEAGDDHQFWVIEVSSYQATTVEVTPPVVAVTSLHADHLPWHRSDEETYYRDKLSLCSRPGADLTIANGDSSRLRGRRGLLGPRVHWVSAADTAGVRWIDVLDVLGEHNRRNALIAGSALAAMGVPEAAADGALEQAAAGFVGLPSRLHRIGEVRGVSFVDDSLSTNVLSTTAAVEVFPDQRVALIVGGQDRGIDYRPLGEELSRRTTPILVLTVPDSGARIARELDEAGLGPMVQVRSAADVAAAAYTGFDWAGPGGVVLLSPAAPSFGRFHDYQERAAVFSAVLADLERPATTPAPPD